MEIEGQYKASIDMANKLHSLQALELEEANKIEAMEEEGLRVIHQAESVTDYTMVVALQSRDLGTALGAHAMFLMVIIMQLILCYGFMDAGFLLWSMKQYPLFADPTNLSLWCAAHKRSDAGAGAGAAPRSAHTNPHERPNPSADRL